MQSVFLATQLIITLCLIGVVLLQRSEGGGLGMGGGGGGVMTGRQAANAMTKVTWGLGTAFLLNAILLTVISAAENGGTSVVDRLAPATTQDTPADTAPADGAALPGEGDDGRSLLPPSASDAPLTPPRSE